MQSERSTERTCSVHHTRTREGRACRVLPGLAEGEVGPDSWRCELHAGILCSRHEQKILRSDDSKVVGDRITEAGPVTGYRLAQEAERRIGELGDCCVGFIVGDVAVHDAPEPLDRIEMRAAGRDEMELDPATW